MATEYEIVTVFNGMSIPIYVNVNNDPTSTEIDASSTSSNWTPTANKMNFSMTTNVNQGIFNWGDNNFFVEAKDSGTGQNFTITIADTVSNANSIQIYAFWLGGSNYEVVALMDGLSSSSVTVTTAS